MNLSVMCEWAVRREGLSSECPVEELVVDLDSLPVGVHGHHYATPTYDPGAVAVYDAEGRYLRSVGGAGEDPGEFREIVRHAILPGDTLVVAGQRQILSTFGPDGEQIRSFARDFPGRSGPWPRSPRMRSSLE